MGSGAAVLRLTRPGGRVPPGGRRASLSEESSHGSERSRVRGTIGLGGPMGLLMKGRHGFTIS